jgi:BlaI family penicillinase repressor
MARKSSNDVTDAELTILQAIWEHGPATIRQLAERIYGEGGASAYGTVQKLLDRLEAKGSVDRDRSESVHVFRATIDREELIGRKLQAVAETLCGGSLTPLLSHLVRGGRLTEKERSDLRSLIERLDRKP